MSFEIQSCVFSYSLNRILVKLEIVASQNTVTINTKNATFTCDFPTKTTTMTEIDCRPGLVNMTLKYGKLSDILLDFHCQVKIVACCEKDQIAICSGKLIKRYSHLNKSVFLYETSVIPITSIAIEVGQYESIRLFSKEEEKESKIDCFYDKKYKHMIQDSCFYLPQVMEFVEQWVGASYPFSSLKIIIKDIIGPIETFATVILINPACLIDSKVVDQAYNARFTMAYAIATQWFGHYITPATKHDKWLTIGFSRIIGYNYCRKVFGNNETKFRILKDTERLCMIDVKQPPICPVNLPELDNDTLVGNFVSKEDPSSLRAELLELKSGLVMLMLEKRFHKQLLTKLAAKFLILQMSGELSGLGTIEFLSTIRKLSGKLEIKEFADQWIYGSGCPIFTTSYNFNRKKMVIELKINQRSSNEGMVGATSKFTGPFVVRVQEPGGTFDTEIRIEEYHKQYDIIYHTKYKRIRRGATKKRRPNGTEEVESEEEEEEDNLNDVIAEPDRITFEWIRLDPDGDWLSHLTFEQDDFMWSSVIRQDKNVAAQYEAIVALGKMGTMPTGLALTALLNDTNLYYRLRMEAAFALTKYDNEQVEFMGLKNLMTYLKEHYFEGDIPKRNNYETLQDYYIKNGILTALVHYRDPRGWTPVEVRKLLLDMVSLNDNGGNELGDSNTVATLLDCIGQSFLQRPKNSDDLAWCLSERIKFKESRIFRSADVEEFEFPSVEEAFSHRNSELVKTYFQEEDHELLEKALNEISRYLVKDRFESSYQNAVTVTCLEVLLKWQIAGLVPPNFPLFLQYSRYGHSPLVRKMAIEALIVTSSLKDPAINRYLTKLVKHDPDPQLQYFTAKGLCYFVSLVSQQLEFASQSAARKATLKRELAAILEMFNSDVPQSAQRYVKKLTEIQKELNPLTAKIKFKMPTLSSIKAMQEETPAIENIDGDSESAKKKTKKPKVKPEKIEKPKVELPPYLLKCKQHLKRLSSSKQGSWFRLPVDPVAMNLPTYLEIIKEPMDFGQIRKKIDGQEYPDEAAFSRDVLLIFNNAMLFNPPTNQVYIDAQMLKIKFEKDFLGIIPPESTKPTEMTPMEIANFLCTKLMQSDLSQIFREPVSVSHYPEYFDVVKNPIDLRTIKKKIDGEMYENIGQFDSDVLLLFDNCFKFNKRGTFGFSAGTELSNYYQKIRKPFAKMFPPRPKAEEMRPDPKIKLNLIRKEQVGEKASPKIILKLPPKDLALPKISLKLSKPKDTPESMPKLKLKFSLKNQTVSEKEDSIQIDNSDIDIGASDLEIKEQFSTNMNSDSELGEVASALAKDYESFATSDGDIAEIVDTIMELDEDEDEDPKPAKEPIKLKLKLNPPNPE